MRIDMPKKVKGKGKKVYLHGEVKKQVAQATKNLEIKVKKIERIEKNRKPDFKRRQNNKLMAINRNT